MDCEYEYRCKNSSKCYRCFNQSLLSLPEDKQRQKHAKTKTYHHKTATSDQSWEDLEQQVADALNKVPTMKEARRARASGALWFEKGDIVDEILHPECKERKGRSLKGTDKSFSIRRDWLEKAKEELLGSGKVMCLPFRFKEDERIYVIFDFNDIAELIQHMKAYMMDNEAKAKEIELLKQQNDQLKTLLASYEPVKK